MHSRVTFANMRQPLPQLRVERLPIPATNDFTIIRPLGGACVGTLSWRGSRVLHAKCGTSKAVDALSSKAVGVDMLFIYPQPSSCIEKVEAGSLMFREEKGAYFFAFLLDTSCYYQV